MKNLFQIIIHKSKEAAMKTFNLIVLAFAFLLSSCSSDDDEGGGGLNPLGSPNQNSSVTINVSHLESETYQDVIEFYFKSSVDITINKVELSVMDFNDELQGDTQTVYQKDEWYMLVGYQGVEVGQEWMFTFYGKESTNNNDYKVTTKYVVNN